MDIPEDTKTGLNNFSLRLQEVPTKIVGEMENLGLNPADMPTDIQLLTNEVNELARVLGKVELNTAKLCWLENLDEIGLNLWFKVTADLDRTFDFLDYCKTDEGIIATYTRKILLEMATGEIV